MAQETSKKPVRITAPERPFRCTTAVQLRYSDLDTHGHVNNSVYFTLFDVAKTDYFNRVYGSPVDATEVGVVIANVNCDFVSPITLYEPVAVLSQVSRIGDKSLTLLHHVVNTDTGELKAACRQVMVYVDAATLLPASVPEVWRKRIRAFENLEHL